MLSKGHVQLFVLLSIFDNAFTTDTKFRVFGGVKLKTEVGQYIVKLKINLNINCANVTKSCSGSVINNQWIISAAHCFKYKINENVVVEQLEGGKFTTGHVNPVDIKLHPKYKENRRINAAKHDIALLRMQSKRKQVFIKLSEDAPVIGQVGTIAGYGETETKSGPNEGSVVIEKKLNVLSSTGKVWGGHGDSGGPLVLEKHLVGVTSRGKCHKEKCTTYYADIYSNINWIKVVMGD